MCYFASVPLYIIFEQKFPFQHQCALRFYSRYYLRLKTLSLKVEKKNPYVSNFMEMDKVQPTFFQTNSDLSEKLY